MRFVKSRLRIRRIQLRGGGEHTLHLLPGRRRREDLHLGAEAEQPGVKLGSLDKVLSGILLQVSACDREKLLKYETDVEGFSLARNVLAYSA